MSEQRPKVLPAQYSPDLRHYSELTTPGAEPLSYTREVVPGVPLTVRYGNIRDFSPQLFTNVVHALVDANIEHHHKDISPQEKEKHFAEYAKGFREPLLVSVVEYDGQVIAGVMAQPGIHEQTAGEVMQFNSNYPPKEQIGVGTLKATFDLEKTPAGREIATVPNTQLARGTKYFRLTESRLKKLIPAASENWDEIRKQIAIETQAGRVKALQQWGEKTGNDIQYLLVETPSPSVIDTYKHYNAALLAQGREDEVWKNGGPVPYVPDRYWWVMGIKVADIEKTTENVEPLKDQEIPFWLVTTPWWEQDYWKEKGLPQQQVEFSNGEQQVMLHNFHESLTDIQLTEIAGVLETFSGIADGKALETTQHILIDNIQEPSSGDEPVNGNAALGQKTVILFPNALRPIPHRVSETISNLTGTVAHELSHSLVKDIEEEWKRVGDWNVVNTERSMPQYKTTQPERCITTYATSNYDEDICDSIVARNYDPGKLDPQKLKLLEQKLPIENAKQTRWAFTNVLKKDIKVPHN